MALQSQMCLFRVARKARPGWNVVHEADSVGEGMETRFEWRKDCSGLGNQARRPGELVRVARLADRAYSFVPAIPLPPISQPRRPDGLSTRLALLRIQGKLGITIESFPATAQSPLHS
jgi:hypothetical protein